jgi:cytochrome c551/c552
MKHSFIACVAAASLLAAASAHAVDMPALTKKHDCDICHDIEKRLVGPAWKDVAKKYKGATKYKWNGIEYGLEEGLVHAVSRGSSGNWGDMPMPANDPSGAKKTEIAELIRFVLELAK